MTARHLIWPRLAAALFLVVAVLRPPAQAQPAPLASWNDGPARKAIVDFVQATTDKASPNFVPPEDRIATFDQDGTLWVEHPLFAQAMFAIDRVRALAPAHPEWKTEEPFKTVLSGDPGAMGHFTEKDWAEIVGVTARC